MGFYISLLTVFANLFIGISVFHNNPKSATNKLLTLLTFILIVWTFTNYISIQVIDLNLAIFWIRIVMMTVACMFPVIFLLADTFPNETLKVKKPVLIVIIIFTILILSLSATELIFKEAVLLGGRITPIPGPVIPLYGINVLIYLIASFIVLFKKAKTSVGAVRAQVRLMLLGMFFTFIISFFTTFVFVVVLKNTQFVILGPVYSLILIGVIAYAIIKHRLLDIRLVVARSVAYTLLVLLLGIFYAGGLLFTGRFLIRESTSLTSVFVSTSLALIIAFSFQPLLRILEKLTDRIFYKDKYDSNKLLRSLSRIMSSTYELSNLTSSLLEKLFSKMKVAYGYQILIKNSSIMWVKSSGKSNHPEFNEKEICSLIYKVAKNEEENILVFEEMTESKEKEIMRSHNLSVVLPLTVENETIGAILMGEKSSGDIYSTDDVNVLKIIAPEVAVAVKNSLSYEEIRRFNITLQEEIERATKDLQLANEKLQALDKLKDEFVSLAAHELRSPMTTIKGSLSTILDGYAGEISDQTREFLTASYTENDRLIRLVNNFLNISRIEAGTFNVVVTKVSMSTLINEVVHNLQISAKEKNLFLNFEQTGVIPLVYADGDKIKEVLINLIGNALKFTRKGGVTVRAKVENGMLNTAVSDTGSGIVKEDQELLFKKFSQGKNYAKQAGGTGLGLYICKQIIEKLNGKVWLESTLGKGSTFFFSLPIAS